jgi:hypothetical protein
MAAIIQTARRMGKIDERQVQITQLGYRRNEPSEPDREEPPHPPEHA